MCLTNPPKWQLFIAGICTGLGFAPLFWWPITLLGVFQLLWWLKANTHAPVLQRFRQSWWFGFGFSLVSFWWVGGSFRFTPLGYTPGIGLGMVASLGLAALMAFWVVLPALFIQKAQQKIKPLWATWLMPFITAIIWVGFEALRATTPYGFAWNLLGYIFAEKAVLLQPAALGGVWLLSGTALFVPATLVWSRTAWAKILYISPFLGLFYWGYLRLEAAPPLKPIGQVALIQPNINQGVKWKEDPLLAAANLLETAQKNQEVDLIILPETALTFVDPELSFATGMLNPKTRFKTGLIYGAPVYANGHYYNSIISLPPAKEHAPKPDVFYKTFLVPFGELIPLKRYLPLFIQQFLPGGGYSIGQGPRTLHTALGTALPLICYEAIFPFAVQNAQYNHKPTFILNVTNDAWFDNTTGPDQHFAIAKVRSVETGLSQVRVANTGISGVIDGYGRAIERSKKEQIAHIQSSIFEQIPPPYFFGIHQINKF